MNLKSKSVIFKSLLTAVLACLLFTCFALGVFFVLPKSSASASADEIRADRTFDRVNYFEISGTTLNGLSQTGRSVIEDSAIKSVALVIPANVTAISQRAFNDMDKILTVSFAEGSELQSIGTQAFYDCDALLSVCIPQNVTVIADSAFEGCEKLIEVDNLSGCGIVVGGDSYGYVGYYAKHIYDSSAGGVSWLSGSSDGYIYYVGNEDEGDSSVSLIGYSGYSTDLTLVGDYNGRNYEIAANAFYNNDNITSVTVLDGVTAIGTNAFFGCDLLRSIVIPASVTSIGLGAFDSCSSLENVEIGEGLQTVANSVFANCTALVDIKLPSTLVSVGNLAFTGCNALKFVYMPENENTVYQTDSFDSTNANLLLIFTDKESYDGSTNKGGLEALQSRWTYIVNVNLHYNGSVVTERKLHGQNFSLTAQDDGNWILDSEASLPVMPGYAQSVWYYDEAYVETATLNDLNDKLLESVAEIDLYTNYVAKPTLRTFSYTYGNAEGGDVLTVLNRFDGAYYEANSTYLTVSVANYNGASAETNSIENAGVYEIQVALNQNYGMWDENVVVTLTVNKATLDLHDYENLRWSISGGDNLLSSGTLYVYENTPYLSAQQDMGEADVKNVIDSYVRYSGSTVTIRIGNADTAKYTVDENSYNSNANSEVGMYTASVNLTPNANYEVVLGTSSNFFNRGLTVTANGDGTYTVEKVWYIVTMTNYLTDAVGGANDYSMLRNRVYGDNNLPQAPYLFFGEQNRINFSIEFNGATIAENQSVQQRFSYYVNSAMPAGEYTIVFSVGEFNEDGVLSPEIRGEYNLTVAEKPLTDTQIAAINTAISGEYEYEYEANTVRFYDDDARESLAAALTNINANLHPSRVDTFWASTEYNRYYDSYSVTFNLNRMRSNVYYTESAYSTSSLSEFAPIEPDTYTVYYQVSAPSGASLVDENSDSRRDNYFTVVIYRVLEIPVIHNPVYSGADNRPYVATNEHYETIWRGDYVTAGDYSVTLRIYDTEHYRWGESENAQVSGANAVVFFNIERAENEWIVSPKATGWTWGLFDASVNLISASVQYGDVSEILYTILDKDGNDIVMGGVTPFKEFKLDANGQIPENLIENISKFKPSTYKLVAYAQGGEGYNWTAIDNTRDPGEFTVSAAINTWVEMPKIEAWVRGQFNAEENLVVVESAYGNENMTVEIYETTNEENVIYRVVNGQVEVDLLDSADVGYYTLKATVAGTENYSELEKTFTFQIFAPEGMPWWVTLVIVLGVLAILVIVFVILQKKGVLQVLSGKMVLAIRAKASADATIAAVRANKIAEASKASIALAEEQDKQEAMRKAAEEANSENKE